MRIRMRDMKKAILDEYPNDSSWPEQVSKMSYRQIAAIYRNIQKKKEKVDANQLTIWGLLKGKELDRPIEIKNGYLKLRKENQVGDVKTYLLAVTEDNSGPSIKVIKIGNEQYSFKELSKSDAITVNNILKGEFKDEEVKS